MTAVDRVANERGTAVIFSAGGSGYWNNDPAASLLQATSAGATPAAQQPARNTAKFIQIVRLSDGDGVDHRNRESCSAGGDTIVRSPARSSRRAGEWSAVTTNGHRRWIGPASRLKSLNCSLP